MFGLPLTYASSPTVSAPQNHFNRPAGFPDGLTIKSIGENLIPLIMQSRQFHLLAHGKAYHEKPFSSFGYTYGPTIPTSERVILFSPDESSYIVTEIELPSNQIQSMYFTDASQANFRFSGVQSDHYAGYRVLYCTGTFFGVCDSTGTNIAVEGTLQVPSYQNTPNGANSACCVFGEWTGASNDQYASSALVQGGMAWSGINLAQLPNALSNGYVLWTEYLPNPPVYYTPPSWMNGVQGQTINLSTQPYDSCSPGNLWYAQLWNLGSNWSTQFVKCDSVVEQYAWYVFESPPSPSCSSGGYNGYCQIPAIPNLGYTGQICLTNGMQSCRNINSYSNPIQGYYIVHTQVDLGNGDIPGGGAAWTMDYRSSL